MTTPEKQGREHFEAWARSEGFTNHALRLGDDGQYQDNWLVDCYRAWRARDAELSAMAKEIERLREALYLIVDAARDTTEYETQIAERALAQTKPEEV